MSICPNCYQQKPFEAKHCPHCTHETTIGRQIETNVVGGISYIAGFVLVIWFLASLFG